MDEFVNHIMVFAAAAILAALARSGVLRRGLSDAPERHTHFTVADLFVGVGLWLLGQTLAAAMAMEAFGGLKAERSPMDELKVGVIAQVGALLSLIYICVRAHASTSGRLNAWGVGLRRPARTIATTLLGFVGIVIILQGVGVLVRDLTIALGAPEPPAIGHAMLEYLTNHPPRAYVLGVALSAVLIAPVIEEVLFRGLIQSTLRQSNLLGTPWHAIIVTSIVFTTVHIGAVMVDEPNTQAALASPARSVAVIATVRIIADADAPPPASDAAANTPADAKRVEPPATHTRFVWQSLVSLFVLSLALGFVYEYTGSLWASVLVHMMFNGMNIALAASGVLDQPQ
ncbi:MAG: CPBP family intramembrane metalloprotease [Phycisphaera sp.]|nr:CPBP family intramembrane metalloprotease [Phycisphaera sp.]